jgi:branched-chain amino acid transport system ATP-binding protein
MLRLEKVHAGYGRTPILQDVSVEVAQGEVVTIVGANGAGKSTTLRAISGLIPITAGRITLDGEEISNLGAPAIVERGITLVPEARQLFPFMSVRDNLLMGAFHRQARAGAAGRLAQVLALFPRLQQRLHQMAGLLSGGEQQMVAIARGLMSAPRLLMFDEPSLGLAPLIVKQVFEIIDHIVEQGTTVLIVEQNVFHTLRTADRGYVLENGRIVMHDTGDALLASPHVKKAYLGI